MQISVLGCAGSMALGHHTTSFLVDDDLLVDAGSGVGTLSVEQMRRIDHVLITHAHLDHVLALPLLADVVIRHRIEQQRGPIDVWALPETLQTLQNHLFNNQLWPDFTRLPSADAPVLKLRPLAVGQRLTLGGRVAEVLPARHVVPAVGYALWHADRPQAGAWGYSGDTGPNPALWRALQRLPHLRHWVMEVAFSDQDRALAQVSGHHSPSTLDRELFELPESVQVHLTHLKPGEWEAVESDLERLGRSRPLHRLQTGDRFVLVA